MRGLPVWTDRKVEDLIGNLLRTGVLLSAFDRLRRRRWFTSRGTGASPPTIGSFTENRTSFARFLEYCERRFRFRAEASFSLGLLLLIATPVARVVLVDRGISPPSGTECMWGLRPSSW